MLLCPGILPHSDSGTGKLRTESSTQRVPFGASSLSLAPFESLSLKKSKTKTPIKGVFILDMFGVWDDVGTFLFKEI